MWIYIIIAIIVLIIIYAFSLYNSFVKLNNKVKRSILSLWMFILRKDGI